MGQLIATEHDDDYEVVRHVDQQGYASLRIAQPTVEGLPLPEKIHRQCCYGKTCWTGAYLYTELRPGAAEGEPTWRVYEYRRSANDEPFGWTGRDPLEAIEWLNDKSNWPLAPRTHAEWEAIDAENDARWADIDDGNRVAPGGNGDR